MKLGEFIEKFSHNNIIRLWHKDEGGHKVVLENANDASMDWEVNKQKGKFRHFINNEVLYLLDIEFNSKVRHHGAINIVIEELENQPFLEEIVENKNLNSEAIS